MILFSSGLDNTPVDDFKVVIIIGCTLYADNIETFLTRVFLFISDVMQLL